LIQQQPQIINSMVFTGESNNRDNEHAANTAPNTGSNTQGGNRAQGGQRNNGKYRVKYPQRNGGRGHQSKAFRGETSALNGNVFQTQEESKDPTQYKRTIEALERYCHKIFDIDMRSLFEEPSSIPVLVRPVRPVDANDGTYDEMDMDIYREQVKLFVKSRQVLEKALRALFAIIWGQCSMNVVTKLTSLEKIDAWRAGGQCDKLLISIRQIMMKYEHQRSTYTTLYKQMRFFFMYRQKDNQDLHRYFEVSQIMIQNIKRYGGSFNSQPAFVKELMTKEGLDYDDDTIEKEVRKEFVVKAEEKFLAIAFLLGGRTDLYGDLVTDLENDYLKGHDYFPGTIIEAYHLMANYGVRKGLGAQRNHAKTNAVGFLQAGSNGKTQKTHKEKLAPGTDGITHQGIECWKCGASGHYSNKCPERNVMMLQDSNSRAPDNHGNGNEFRSSNPDVTNDDYDSEDGLGFGFLQVNYSLLQSGSRYDGLNENWVLLDTQSNCDIFRNKKLLKNIRNHEGPGLLLQSNGGEMRTQAVGDVDGYGTVWFSPSSMANILSFTNVRKRFRVTIDTGPDDAFPKIIVHRSNGKEMVFREHAMGLYVHDVSKATNTDKHNDNLMHNYDYSFVNTVVNLESQFSKHDIKRAKSALKLYIRLGRPIFKLFENLIKRNQIRDCDVNIRDIQMMQHIYGPDPASVKGRAVRRTPGRVRTPTYIALPQYIKDFHLDVILCIDIFYLNGLPFFHTISRSLQFRTVEELKNRQTSSILTCLQNAMELYLARGFRVAAVHADPEFQPLAISILPSILHVVAKGAHVPEIERSIRTMKERIRTVIHGLPFRSYTRLMIASLVHFITRLLNQFPRANSICRDLSPLSMITGADIPSIKEFSIEFGAYVVTHDAITNTNTTAPRGSDAIALCPANSSGGWYFMNLSSGRRILRSKWTECVIHDNIIACVHQLAAAEHHSSSLDDDAHRRHEMSLVDIKGAYEYIEYEDENNNNNENAAASAAEDANNRIEAIANENENDNNENMQQDMNNITDDEADVAEEESINRNEGEETLDENEEEIEEEAEIRNLEIEEEAEIRNPENEVFQEESEVFDFDQEQEQNEENKSNDHIEERSENTTGNRNGSNDATDEMNPSIEEQEHDDNHVPRYNLRSGKKNIQENAFNKKHYNYLNLGSNMSVENAYYTNNLRSFINRIQNGKKYNITHLHECLIGYCMTQMSAYKGVKTYGDRAVEAMAKEYAQLHDLSVFRPLGKDELDEETKKSALNVIDLIKEKRCGKIKGRTVVDGRGQRGTYQKHQTSSDALTVEGFICTLVIEAHEGRATAVGDIAGAFLKAIQPDRVIIKLRGPAVDAILQVDYDKYVRFITLEGKTRVIYMVLLRAMYGTLTAAILWYRMFATSLIEMGFRINRLDPCVANKLIDGTQCTICWYVDDVKISHMKESVITEILNKMENTFGKMTISRGKKHVYLGINYEIKNSRVHIVMKEYLQESIDAYGEVINTNAATPATKDLSVINENSKVLEKRRHEIFHHIVQKLLHVSKRGRLDLQVSIAFLCTRVRYSTEQDWIKLKRVLQYVRGTINLERVISIDGLDRMDVYVDASHGTHADFKGHTGGCIAMGLGVLHGRSSKQAINTRSSTETELVGNSDYLPYPIWLIYFFEEQGYVIRNKYWHQDNQSTIKMLINGRKSCGKQSRHVNLRYFWTVDRIKEMGFRVTYCPTLQMLGDFFTKPLQGTLFRLMRDVTQGLLPYSKLIEFAESKKSKIDETLDINMTKNEQEENDVALTHHEERVGELVFEENGTKGKKVKFHDDVNVMKREKSYADVVKNIRTVSTRRSRGKKHEDMIKMNED